MYTYDRITVNDIFFDLPLSFYVSPSIQLVLRKYT